MISVEAALAALFAEVEPMPPEEVPLTEAAGRVLAADAVAARDQPPFAAAAMDGYALADPAPGAVLKVTGEAAAGRRHRGRIGPGEAVRIFTGAPVPPGATHVVPQEDVARDGMRIVLGADAGRERNIRPLGGDFAAGARLLAPRRLGPAQVALLAAMGLGRVRVARAPEVALIATGDELVPPGEAAGPDQIFCSNSYGLHAALALAGARPRLLPVVPDRPAALAQAFALAAGADLILTIGGASVGDHDLVAEAARSAGAKLAFHKVAIRPGKPLMAGRLHRQMLIGLPGNPVSAMVCGVVFVLPVIRAMLGLPARPAPRRPALLSAPLPPNGPREHYLRARSTEGGVAPFPRQDSSLLSVLSEADVLIVQPPGDAGRPAGSVVEVIDLD